MSAFTSPVLPEEAITGERSSGGVFRNGVWKSNDLPTVISGLSESQLYILEVFGAIACGVSQSYEEQMLRMGELWPAELLENPSLLPVFAAENPFALSPYAFEKAGFQSPEGLLEVHRIIADEAQILLDSGYAPENLITYLTALSALWGDLSSLPIDSQVYVTRLFFEKLDRIWVNIQFLPGDLFALFGPAESYGDPGEVIGLSLDPQVQEILNRIETLTGLSIFKRFWECKIGMVVDLPELSESKVDDIRVSVANLFGGDQLVLSKTDIVIIDLLLASGRAAFPMTNLAKNYPANAHIDKRRSVIYRNVILAVIDEFLAPIGHPDIFESNEEATNYALALLIAHEQAHAHEAITYSNSLEEMRVILASFIAVSDSGIFEEDSNSHNKLATIFMGYMFRYQQKYAEAIERDPNYSGSNSDYHNAVTMILNEFQKKDVGNDSEIMLNVSRGLLKKIRACVDNPANGATLKSELYDPSIWNKYSV